MIQDFIGWGKRPSVSRTPLFPLLYSFTCLLLLEVMVSQGSVDHLESSLVQANLLCIIFTVVLFFFFCCWECGWMFWLAADVDALIHWHSLFLIGGESVLFLEYKVGIFHRNLCLFFICGVATFIERSLNYCIV